MRERPVFDKHWILFLLIIGIVGIQVLLFLWQAYRIAGELGFPLDDAWIHARFADNLARGYGFSYNRGVPSSGSTSPLWVLLLAISYSVGVTPIASGVIWGVVLLIASCWMTYRLTLELGQSYTTGILAAVLTALMSRLIWGALSGMEVSLYVFLTLLGLTWHIRYDLNSGLRSYLSTFVFALAALARPECYLLFPLAWLDRVLMHQYKPSHLAKYFLLHLILYMAALIPNLIFNVSVTGSIFPATFHAKVEGGLFEAIRAADTQMLVEALTIRPVGFVYQYVMFWLENNIVLLLPACWGLVVLVRQRHQIHSMILPLVFVLIPLTVGVFSGWGELVGRYVANMIPLYGVLAAVGIVEIVERVKRIPFSLFSARLIRSAFLFLVLLNAVVVGRYASVQYGWMVENINGMQVSMGHWIAENIPPDALIAINDVGAPTYFGNRKIIDTVGLTTPDIIPYLKRPEYTRDENVLSYLQKYRPEYLIVYPNWYPELVERTDLFEQVHKHIYPGGRNVTLGGEVMIVYRAHWPQE